jgi:hypothetical protein
MLVAPNIKKAKPIRVEIHATSEGVLLKTSEGTQIRAKSIHLETGSIGHLQVHQADAVISQPKPETKPGTAPLNSLPTY